MVWTSEPRPAGLWTLDAPTGTTWANQAVWYDPWNVEPVSTRRITQASVIRVTEQGIIRIIERFPFSWTNQSTTYNPWTVA